MITEDGLPDQMKACRPVYYPNMDLIRYVLAFGVVVAHFNLLTDHSVGYFISSSDCVGAFFALSGFLVYPSFEKVPDLRKYCADRAFRILPPYFTIVFLCAAALVFASNLTPAEYFSSSGFWKYLAANLSFLNWIHPSLPGVFQGDSYVVDAVNGSLWTMKVEWCLYLSVPIVVWGIRRFRLNRYKTVVAIIALSIIYRLGFAYLYETTGSEMLRILSRQFFGQLSYFYVGVLIYFCRGRFSANLLWMFCLGLTLYLLTPSIPYGHIIISPVAVSVSVLALSLTTRTPAILRHRHNVSYEIYLFHFPIEQLLIFAGLNTLPVWASLTLVTAATVVLALFCHFTVGLPFLRLKRKLRGRAFKNGKGNTE